MSREQILTKKNKQKVPEKSTSDRIEYHKGQTRGLRKRIDNLEKRMFEMEQRLAKYKELIPEPDKFAKYAKKKTNERDEINKKFNPKYKKEEK